MKTRAPTVKHPIAKAMVRAERYERNWFIKPGTFGAFVERVRASDNVRREIAKL